MCHNFGMIKKKKKVLHFLTKVKSSYSEKNSDSKKNQRNINETGIVSYFRITKTLPSKKEC